MNVKNHGKGIVEYFNEINGGGGDAKKVTLEEKVIVIIDNLSVGKHKAQMGY